MDVIRSSSATPLVNELMHEGLERESRDFPVCLSHAFRDEYISNSVQSETVDWTERPSGSYTGDAARPRIFKVVNRNFFFSPPETTANPLDLVSPFVRGFCLCIFRDGRPAQGEAGKMILSKNAFVKEICI